MNDVLNTEPSLDKKQLLKAEELLKYCQEFGIDDESLKFTNPDYYLQNIRVSN